MHDTPARPPNIFSADAIETACRTFFGTPWLSYPDVYCDSRRDQMREALNAADVVHKQDELRLLGSILDGATPHPPATTEQSSAVEPVSNADEFTAFERGMRSLRPMLSRDSFQRGPDGKHLRNDIECAWLGWQAAQSAAPPPSADDAPAGERERFEAWAKGETIDVSRGPKTYKYPSARFSWAAWQARAAAPDAPRSGDAPVAAEVYGWAVLDKNGCANRVVSRLAYEYGTVEPTVCDGVMPELLPYLDREYRGVAPHRVVTLYTTPVSAPAQGPAAATYFSYGDDNGGFETHATAAEARAAADESLGYFRDDAPEGWNDGVRNVCWGVILGEIVETESRPTTPADPCYPDCSQFVEYELRDCVTGLSAPADARDGEDARRYRKLLPFLVAQSSEMANMTTLKVDVLGLQRAAGFKLPAGSAVESLVDAIPEASVSSCAPGDLAPLEPGSCPGCEACY